MKRRPDLVILAILATATVLYCRGVLVGLWNWGQNDWDQHFFYSWSTYRSVMEFSELPLWNPWYLGGNPLLGNPQVQFPTPMLLFDLAAGPILGMKLKILAHHWLGLVGTYWLSRQVGLSRYAGLLAAGAFMLSTWYSLRLFEGHTPFFSMAFVPWVLAFIHRARNTPGRSVNIVAGAAFLALIVFEGGIYPIIYTLFLSGMLAVCWSLQERSWTPVAVLVLSLSLGAGLSAAKLIPVVKLMHENPRETALGGDAWNQILTGRDLASTTRSNASGSKVLAASRWDLVYQAIKVFLGRDQRGGESYFAHQHYGWHEYGAYLGPFIIGLIALSPLVFRQQWPWLASAAGCFLIALGNFAPIAPWTLLHHFPVMNNARVPTRFLMPCVLALAISAGFVFDTLRAWMKGRFSETRLEWATALVVAVCLADLVLVGGRSFEGTFDRAPQPIEAKNANIVTIAGRASNMLAPMLQNYCTKNAYEEARIPVNVSAVDERSYRGEVYFVPGREARAQRQTETPSSTAGIVRWSPNTVNVLVHASVSGWLVVNRNWNDGWISSPPYHAQPRNGLLAAALESGEHLVQFSYRPKSAMVGAAISFFSVIAAALGCWLDWDLGKRRNSR